MRCQQELLAMFSQVIEKAPESIAIEGPCGTLTYRDLEERSNDLAGVLLGLGIPQNSLLAVLYDNRVEVIIALLTAIKIGCIFVPLDPAIPEARLRAMLKDIAPRWLLTESSCSTTLQQIMEVVPGAHILFSDTRRVAVSQAAALGDMEEFPCCANEQRITRLSAPDDICYIYFTSGSTGTPKRIAGSRRAIEHFINWEIETFRVEAGTRVSQLANPTFDAFLRDVFVPLCAGGTICLPAGKDTIADASKLVLFLERQRINLVHCVPSLFRSILNQKLTPGNLSALSYILMAGESLLPADVKKWVEIYGERIQLINLYGTSETTMAKFFYFVKASDKDRQSIPVGQPLEGAKALVLDTKRRACPPGIVGEIYIQTPFRLPGYYNQPELTEQAFVPHPLEQEPGDLVYKTGDLGRILDDGNLEYLGRKDQQVKVRGVRVEIDEIENLLRNHQAIEDVAVVARDDSSGSNYLCAYVVPSEEIKPAHLRAFLGAYLPDAMIPSAYVIMEKLPRTISGKVDRKSLPVPQQLSSDRQQSLVPPRTAVEEILVNIWARTLGLEQVGIQDNFFELGGHSLLATQVNSQVRNTFQVELSLGDLLQAPTIAGLAERIALIQQRGRQGSVIPPLQPLSHGNCFPLSFAQQRLWFIDQFDPESSAYNLQGALRIQGNLDKSALERALQEIVRRHEALRTTFSMRDNRPVQIIGPSIRIALLQEDLSALPANEQEAEIRKRAKGEAQKPFQLSRGPLLKALLLQLGQDVHILLLVMHHIVFDIWSLGVFHRELAELYTAFSSGKQAGLPDLPVQYADFTLWQREWLQGELLADLVAYWKQQLAGAPELLELPADRPRPAVQRFEGAHHSFVLPQPLVRSLKTLSRQSGCTFFMTLIAAFQTLLARYTGQTDIVVGTPIANRMRSELEGLIGFFVNTLVLRTDLSGDPTFHELLARVREVTLGAYAHQDMPFEKLVEVLRPARDLSHTPLFQVAFVLQNAPFPSLDMGDLRVDLLETHHGTSNFDLSLTMMEDKHGLRGTVEYNTDLFDVARIVRLVEHFQMLLQGIVADPYQRLSIIPLLTEAELRQLSLVQKSTYPAHSSVHQLFEAQVERAPEAVALVFEGEELTYRDLNRRANQLAHHLQSQGVGPEVLVAICLNRSLEMIVALLAVLKAGGAYVPLDPSYPGERLAFMLQDSQAVVLLTHQRHRQKLALEGQRVICLDTDWQRVIAREREDNPNSRVDGANLAYVIYTSGSTGQPKGVLIPHSALLNHSMAFTEHFNPHACDRILQFASISFDAAAEEIFPALLGGARLVVRGDDALDLSSFMQLAEEEHLTVLNLPTSYWHVWIAHLPQDTPLPPSLRLVIVGGEKVSTERFIDWGRWTGGRVRWANTYGPTEATITATIYEPDCSDGEGRPAGIPIGRPISNVRARVLDRFLQPVPVGVPGELYIGGAGLARGYLNQPELTRERFIPDPFGGEPGEVLYKTGDLVCFLPGGELEFLGRIDQQVKIRGFRIELAEIETILNHHPAVQDAAVLARKISDDDSSLVAYVAPHRDQVIHTDELRRYLQEKLPAYMVPTDYILRDILPLTTNGKIDRKSLLTENARRQDRPERTFAPPRTRTEQMLAAIWADLLNLEQISIHDNFFELGGHSFLTIRMLDSIHRHFKRKLLLSTLFKCPTIEQLAGVLDQPANSIDSPSWSPLVEIQPTGCKRPLFFVHPISGSILCYTDLARALGPDQPLYGLQARGLDGEQEPYTSIEEMAQSYLEALQRVQPAGPYLLGGWSMGGLIAFEMAQCLRQHGQEVAFLALVDSRGYFSRTSLRDQDETELMTSFAQELEGYFAQSLSVSRADLQHLQREEQLRYIYERAMSEGLISRDTEPELLRRLFRVFEANMQALYRYTPRVYADRITLFLTTEPRVDLLEATGGWESIASGGVESHVVPGNHFTLVREPHVQHLSDQLKACIDVLERI